MPRLLPSLLTALAIALCAGGPWSSAPGPGGLGWALPGAGQAAAQDGKTGRVTGLPIPRFVSLRPDEVNLRTGPGTRYPIDWVYRRAGMPLEVIGEYRTWRQVRDWQDDTGWVHEVMLQAERTARILGEAPRPLRADPRPDARPVARLAPGVIASLDRCEGRWCRLSAQGHTGWLPRDAFYGAYPGERVGD
jgi:SH3-like domain-containing protein